MTAVSCILLICRMITAVAAHSQAPTVTPSAAAYAMWADVAGRYLHVCLSLLLLLPLLLLVLRALLIPWTPTTQSTGLLTFPTAAPLLLGVLLLFLSML
jgi:hypothetical protein